MIVFSTAYDEYAIKAFEKNAVDYLLKPYALERFNEALGKAKNKVGQKEPKANQTKKGLAAVVNAHFEKADILSRVVVKTGSKINIIPVDKIRYIEAMDDYVRIYTDEGKYLKQHTMKHFENYYESTQKHQILQVFQNKLRIRKIS